jgi:hypothetical protein
VFSRHVLALLELIIKSQLPMPLLVLMQRILKSILLHVRINSEIILQDFAHTISLVYDIAWQGITNLTRNGPDYTVGATRTFTSKTAVGTLTFIEKVRFSTIPCLSAHTSYTLNQLDDFQTAPDGSYIARFSQFNPPLKYADGSGSFSGYWITFDAEYAAEYETVLKWTVYACLTGHPFDYRLGHSKALAGLLATMDKAGLVKGNTTGPYFTQNY